MRAIAAAALIAALPLCAAFAESGAAAASLRASPLRSSQASLPESIQRETYAAIDRARQALDAAISTPSAAVDTVQSATSTAPAAPAAPFALLALCAPGSPDTASRAAAIEIERILAAAEAAISKPWEADFIFAVSAAVLADASDISRPASSDRPSLARILSRLSRADISKLDADAAAFLLLALSAHGADTPAQWRALNQRLAASPQSAEENPRLALQRAALSALCRLMSAPAGRLSGPSPAAIAHLRWISKRLDLRFGNNPVGADEILTPCAAFYTAMSASRLPRTLFAAPAPPLPYDWRNHLASRIVTQQLCSPADGAHYWNAAAPSAPPGAPESIRDTAFAILALLAISD